MKNIKNKIKKLLPDKIVYFIKVTKIIPQYLICKINNAGNKKVNIGFFTDEETVKFIVEKRYSMSRFGDGEFMWMSGERTNTFQDYSEEFSQRLRNAFQCKNERLLVGIPLGMFDSSKCNLYAKMYWYIIRQKFLQGMLAFVDFNRKYCNASISRPYIDYKSKEYSKKAFDNLKKIWNEKDITIVEGKYTKLGMGNDLFDNANSIKRIICPSINAFEKIEEIKSAIRLLVSKETMIIGALGPTASILAAELVEEGYQFVDIGHVDVEYIWYLRNAVLREPIEGKHVNESGVKTASDLYEFDSKYINSIIFRIE